MVAAIAIPLIYSIAFGILNYVSLKLRTGCGRDVSPVAAVLAMQFLLRCALVPL